jgi:hypothetical protein
MRGGALASFVAPACPMFELRVIKVQPLNSYYFHFSNSCPRNVLVDIDDCQQDADMHAQGKVSTVQVGQENYVGFKLS